MQDAASPTTARGGTPESGGDLGNELDGIGSLVGARSGHAHDCEGAAAELVSHLLVLKNQILSFVHGADCAQTCKNV